MCLVFYSFVGGADTSGSIDLDYMVEKLGIDKSKIDDLSNLLYKNYGTTMAGLRVLFHLLSFHFLAQNGNSLLNSEISDDLWLFCFIVNSGNWIWLWLRWISQVHAFFFFLTVFTLIYYSHVCLWWNWFLKFGYYSFVHGRLPYENLKPDPVLRNLLLSLPYRKLVSCLKSIKLHNILQRKFENNPMRPLFCLLLLDFHKLRQSPCC